MWNDFIVSKIKPVNILTVRSLWFVFRPRGVVSGPHDIATIRVTAHELLTISQKIHRLHVLREKKTSKHASKRYDHPI